MKFRLPGLTPVIAIPLLAGCAVLPSGPSVMVLPGTGKSFEQFRNDNQICRQFAYAQIGGATPHQAAVDSGVASAVAGTAIGAAAGAALGGGEGAAIGAGTGLLAGSIAGADAAAMSGYEAQERFDMSYIQCMYAKGNRVPVSGNFIDDGPQQRADPVSNFLQPPPPGAYAPPLR